MTIISLGLATGHRCERRLLSSFGLGEQPAGGRIGDCCGEDCPFQPSGPKTETEWFLLLSCPKTRQSGLSTSEDASLAFTRHPRSMQLGLSSGPYRSSDRPSLSLRSVVKVSNETLVPKGRLELPWVAPLRPERSASAISPLRREDRSHPGRSEPTRGLEPRTCCLRNSCSTN